MRNKSNWSLSLGERFIPFVFNVVMPNVYSVFHYSLVTQMADRSQTYTGLSVHVHVGLQIVLTPPATVLSAKNHFCNCLILTLLLLDSPDSGTLSSVPTDLRASTDISSGRHGLQLQGWMNTTPLGSNMSVISKRSSAARKGGDIGLKYTKAYMRRRLLIMSLLVSFNFSFLISSFTVFFQILLLFVVFLMV